MAETTETRICDRPGCGATFTPSRNQRWHFDRGLTARMFCSRSCYQATWLGEATAEHPPASSYSDAKLVAEMRERTARGQSQVWPAPKFRAPTEAERARGDRAA